MPAEQQPIAEPPDGVITGESVPRENEERQFEQTVIDALVGSLKTHRAYSDYSDDELEDVAWRYAQKLGEL